MKIKIQLLISFEPLFAIKLLVLGTTNMDRLVAFMVATGRSGKHIVQKPLDKDIRVRILSRDLSKAKRMFGNRVEVMEGDLLKTKDLKSMVTGVSHLFAAHDAEYYLGERDYEGSSRKAGGGEKYLLVLQSQAP